MNLAVDQFGYEKASERWSPVQSVGKLKFVRISFLFNFFRL